MRENLRRRHPSAGEKELDSLLAAWLRDQPMDAPDERFRGQEGSRTRSSRRCIPADAIALLEKCAPETGHIFGFHDTDPYVKAAAQIVFADRPHYAENFGAYHLRHFFATFMLKNTKNLAGAMHQMGHTQAETLSGYVDLGEEDAADMMKDLNPKLRAARAAATKCSSGRKATEAAKAAAAERKASRSEAASKGVRKTSGRPSKVQDRERNGALQ